MIIEYLLHTEKIPLNNLAFDIILIYLVERIKVTKISIFNWTKSSEYLCKLSYFLNDEW